MSSGRIPYLPTVKWYASVLRRALCGDDEPLPPLPRHFCRAEVLAPFGLRTLSVPIEGGRRIISPARYSQLRLSEHGDWRHTHFQTLCSAYGSAPYFHFMEERFRAIYDRRFDMLSDLCRELDEAIRECMRLPEAIEGLRASESFASGRIVELPSEDISAVHLLFHAGPESVFTLLALDRSEMLNPLKKQ